MQNSEHQFLPDQDEQVIKSSDIQPQEQVPQGQNIIIDVVSQKKEINSNIESEVLLHKEDKPNQNTVILDYPNIQTTTLPQDSTSQQPNNQQKMIDTKAGKIDEQIKNEMQQQESKETDQIKQTDQIGDNKIEIAPNQHQNQLNIIQKDEQKKVDKRVVQKLNSNLKSNNVAKCKYCYAPLKLIQDHKISDNTILCGFIICLVLTPLFSWIPFVFNDCQDTVHACASCGQTIFMVKEYKIC